MIPRFLTWTIRRVVFTELGKIVAEARFGELGIFRISVLYL